MSSFDALRQFLPDVDVPREVKKTPLTDPLKFLAWVKTIQGKRLNMGDFEMLQAWAIAAICALSRKGSSNAPIIEFNSSSQVSRFAYSLGLSDVIVDRTAGGTLERGRTVKLKRVLDFASIEPVSDQISRLIVSDAEDPTQKSQYFDPEETRQTIYYVMVELLRNVIQHSKDPLGAVILAQGMEVGYGYDENPCIQIAVVDCGVGIYDSLTQMRPEVTSPGMALERSILPHYSGAFPEWMKGTSQNAGLGLFFISEMVKSLGGRMLISSRGATLRLQGDTEGLGNNEIRLYSEEFPGTLVVFEILKRGVSDYDALIKVIQERARMMQGSSERITHLRYDIAPEGAFEFMVKIAIENTAEAEKFSKQQLQPRIEKLQPIVLNFSGIGICTQSFLHALLFDALRLAYQKKSEIYIRKAEDSVVDGLKFLEGYALKEE